MKKPCRDCGNELELNARGCSRCAMNVEAEQMIDRLIWKRIVPFLVLVLVVGAAMLFLLLRR